MNFRYKFSIILVLLGIMSAIMSFRDTRSKGFTAKEILSILHEKKFIYTSDELARYINDADSLIQIIDIRSKREFLEGNLPGSLNIPFENLFDSYHESIFKQKSLIKIIVDRDDLLSTQAWILAMQEGYLNTYVLKGGMKEWDSTIMKSAFAGDKISPKENALFENRYKVRRLFNQWNNMSDSEKLKFFDLKKEREKKLVGGCE